MRSALLRAVARHSPRQPPEGRLGPRSLSVKRCTGGGAGAGRDEPGAPAAAKGGDRQQRRGTQSGEEELWLLVSAATMATVDLEKLRMSGAGKAIGVLTSGGDAQGDGARRRVYGWTGFLPVVGLLRRDRRPSPWGTWGYESRQSPSGATRLQVPVPRLRPRVTSVRAAGHGPWHAPPSRFLSPPDLGVCPRSTQT